MENLLKILAKHGVNVIHVGLNSFSTDNVIFNVNTQSWEPARYRLEGARIVGDDGEEFRNVWEFLGY